MLRTFDHVLHSKTRGTTLDSDRDVRSVLRALDESKFYKFAFKVLENQQEAREESFQYLLTLRRHCLALVRRQGLTPRQGRDWSNIYDLDLLLKFTIERAETHGTANPNSLEGKRLVTLLRDISNVSLLKPDLTRITQNTVTVDLQPIDVLGASVECLTVLQQALYCINYYLGSRK